MSCLLCLDRFDVIKPIKFNSSKLIIRHCAELSERIVVRRLSLC